MKYYDFIAIDFETATDYYNSACSIGIAAVKNGHVVDKFYSLLCPPNLCFSDENIAIHGLTPEMVKDSPSLSDIWSDIEHYFQSSLVVAHNAHFDMSVLKMSGDTPYIPNFKYIDSISVAKDYVPGSKTLENCAKHFNIDMGLHHNALDDAITCAKIVLECLEQSCFPNIGAFCFSKENISIHSFADLSCGERYKNRDDIHSKKKANNNYSFVRVKDIVAQTADFDSNHPFYGKYITFTGQLHMNRKDAMQLAVDLGAFVKDDISKKINYLVVGEKDPEFTDENGLSRKEIKAMELNNSGKASIILISEDEFLSIVKKEKSD